MKKVITGIMIIIFCMAPFSALAGTTLHFAWDNQEETDLAGYLLYQRGEGQAYDYTKSVGTTGPGATELILPDVKDGTWFWVLRAYDKKGNQSEDSNEVTLNLDTPPGKRTLEVEIIVRTKVIVNQN